MLQKFFFFAALSMFLLLFANSILAHEAMEDKADYLLSRCSNRAEEHDKNEEKVLHSKKHASISTNQLGIDISPLIALSLSYARKIKANKLYGFAVGFAWEENANTFNKNIWNVLHGELFVRFQPSNSFHFDFGVTALGFSPHDDDDRRGFFFGGYGELMIGYRYVFFAPRARIGIADDYRGSEFGMILSPLVLRIIIPW